MRKNFRRRVLLTLVVPPLALACILFAEVGSAARPTSPTPVVCPDSSSGVNGVTIGPWTVSCTGQTALRVSVLILVGPAIAIPKFLSVTMSANSTPVHNILSATAQVSASQLASQYITTWNMASGPPQTVTVDVGSSVGLVTRATVAVNATKRQATATFKLCRTC